MVSLALYFRRFQKTIDVFGLRLHGNAFRRIELRGTSTAVQCSRSSGHLWRSLSSVLGRDRDISGTTGYTADQFAAFFAQKIDGRLRLVCRRRPYGWQIRRRPLLLRSEWIRRWNDGHSTRCRRFSCASSSTCYSPYVTGMVNACLIQGRLVYPPRRNMLWWRLFWRKLGLIRPTCQTIDRCRT